jgi:uncharacterized protein with GYD domain
LSQVVGRCIRLLTDQGIRNAKEGPKRAANVRKIGEASRHYTLRQHDLLAMVELEDDESIVKVGLELRRLGSLRTTTSRPGRGRRWRASPPA